MKKNILIVTLVLCSFFSQVVAQTSMKIAGIIYTIPPFKTDSGISYNDWFVNNRIVSSIKDSNYPLEIRFWFKPWFMRGPDEGDCLVIRGNKDSLFADLYQLQWRFMPPHNSSGVVFRKSDTHPTHDIILTHYHFTDHQKLDSLVNSLLKNGITDQPDDKKLMDELKSKKVKLIDGSASDCCTTFNYEIKVKKHFRNFTIYPFYYDNNPKIKEFQNGANLIEAGYNFDHWIVFHTYVRFH